MSDVRVIRTVRTERVRVTQPGEERVRVATPGPPGPPGPQGPPGEGVAAYTHVQGTPAATWSIVHNMGYRPNFVVEDSDGEVVLGGDPDYPDANTLVIHFGASFSGVAYLS